eukprot:Skav201219  [mRNA]  locus=scaffold651:494149:503718:- [translate_table: standard]
MRRDCWLVQGSWRQPIVTRASGFRGASRSVWSGSNQPKTRRLAGIAVAAMQLVQELLQKMQESLALAKGDEDVVLRCSDEHAAYVHTATEMLQKHGYVVTGEEKKQGIRRCAWIFRLTLKESTSMCDEEPSINRLDECLGNHCRHDFLRHLATGDMVKRLQRVQAVSDLRAISSMLCGTSLM